VTVSGPHPSRHDEERQDLHKGPPPQPVLKQLRLLWEHRALLYTLIVSDLRFRYVGSSIGFFWTVVNPIIELVTYTFVFHVLMGVKFHPAGGTVHYGLFLFCGMVCWFALANGLSRGTTSIRENAHLIKKVNFPAAVLPAHVVFSAVFSQVIRSSILFLGVIFLGDGLSAHVLAVPLVILLQACFVLGLAFFLATAQVFFRDTADWVNAGLMIWMFVTPIFYPPAAYPRKFQILLQLNPMAHIVGIYQELILNQRLPDARQVMFATVFAVFSLVVGYSIFVHHRRRFADLI
jgi:ABC-type polysaccharide/polyol phosphate export permease